MGKALRATAVNRLGARLVGIRTTLSGQIAFLLASVIGAISGILIVPITTLYYDTGFLIGLKGFIAAIIGGLVSYPLTAVAALDRRQRRGLLLVLCQQLQGGHRLHADPSRAGAAFARGARGRGREGLTAMNQRLPLLIFALVMAAIPFIPGMPPFWIVLLDNIGLAALVAMGLVLLTGVGGLTSFGQAAFCGFGAYTTAVLTTAYGVSPWLTLPLSLLVSGIAAVLLGIVTVRLSGHYLPLGTIAWGIGLFYLFSKLEFLGRNDGISGIPPLSIGIVQDARSRHDLFRDLDRGADLGAADHEPAGLPHRPRHPRAAARAYRRRSVRRADAARQAAGVHLCGGAGRPVRLALCAFPARRQPDAVRRAGRHRISVHRRGRRRRLCLGRACSAPASS